MTMLEDGNSALTADCSDGSFCASSLALALATSAAHTTVTSRLEPPFIEEPTAEKPLTFDE